VATALLVAHAAARGQSQGAQGLGGRARRHSGGGTRAQAAGVEMGETQVVGV
jgi:hypothetical protein